MIKRNELVKLFYINEIDKFFGDADIDKAFKEDKNNKEILELNFSDSHYNKIDENKKGIDKTYKEITYIKFNVDNIDSVIIGSRAAVMYSNKFTTILDTVFSEIDENINVTRDGFIINTHGDYKKFFNLLENFLSVIKSIKEDNIEIGGNKGTTSKEIDKKNRIKINMTKDNFLIEQLAITVNNTFALKISYKGGRSISFLNEMNDIRLLNCVKKHDGNTIEFDENIGIADLIKELNKLGWQSEYIEEMEQEIENNEEIVINTNSEEFLDTFANELKEKLNSIYFNKFSDKLKRKKITEYIWDWTERNGKYIGCAIWSKKSFDLLKQFDGKISKIQGVLVHEHIIPKNIITSNLMNCDKTLDSIKDILLKSKAAIILKEEDDILSKNGHRNNMPEYLKDKNLLDFTKEDEFARYINTEIELIDVITGKKII